MRRRILIVIHRGESSDPFFNSPCKKRVLELINRSKKSKILTRWMLMINWLLLIM
ncbi:hypothetical protein DsansV1_C01g0006551 [Dioscorea sansibarensis]